MKGNAEALAQWRRDEMMRKARHAYTAARPRARNADYAAVEARLERAAQVRGADVASLAAGRARGPGFGGSPQNVIDVMTVDGNSKQRHALKADAVERAFRRGLLADPTRADAEQRNILNYRIARCLEEDWLAQLPPSGGTRWAIHWPYEHREAVLVILPRTPGGVGAAEPEWKLEAMQRLREAHRAVIQRCGRKQPVWEILREFIVEGRSFRNIEDRRPARHKMRWVAPLVREALEAIDNGATIRRVGRDDDTVKPYETRKWAKTPWAAAAR